MGQWYESLDFQRLIDSAPDSIERGLKSAYYRYTEYTANTDHVSPTEGYTRRNSAPDHVLILIIDALRPDFEPSLDLEFTRAIAPGTWTFPSVTSIHTGAYPHEHEAVAHTSPDDEDYVMPEQATVDHTLPSVLEASGYDTYGGFAFMTPFLATKGWYQKHRVYQDVDSEQVVDDYRSWRRNRDRTFGYLHLGDLHAPITPPQEYVANRDVDTSIEDLGRLVRFTDDYDDSPECERFRAERLKLYRAALDYVEDVLTELLTDVGENTLVLVTGDHGEAHWEHHELDRRFTDSRPNYGVGHGGTPFDMVARVPLAFHDSNRSRTPRGGYPTLCDIPTAVCDHVLRDHPFIGADWETPISESRTAICEATRYGTERKAAYRGDEKVIHSRADQVTLSAKLEPSAGEDFSEPSLSPESTERLLEALPEYWHDGNVNRDTGRIVEEQLSALGYK